MKFKTAVRNIYGRLAEHQIFLYAAQGAYFMIMSAVPFLMALLSLLQYILPISKEDMTMIVADALPGVVRPLATSIIAELYSSASLGILIFTILLALWTSTTGIIALQRCLHLIYGIPLRENYFRLLLRTVRYTLIFVLVILASLFLLVYGNTIQHQLSMTRPYIADFQTLIVILRAFAATLLYIFLFFKVYSTLSGAKKKFIEVLPGILFSTAGWMIFTLIYAVYVIRFSVYTSLYGGIGLIVVLMLWMYFCFVILLCGAEFNVFFEYIMAKKRIARRRAEQSAEQSSDDSEEQ